MTEKPQQFVVQEHTTPGGVHWDFMLEIQDVLWTWRLETNPAKMDNTSIQAERIFDHNVRFLTYEGPVQNGTGRVCISDKGVCRVLSQNETALEIQLEGGFLSGHFKLFHIEGAVWGLEKLDC